MKCYLHVSFDEKSFPFKVTQQEELLGPFLYEIFHAAVYFFRRHGDRTLWKPRYILEVFCCEPRKQVMINKLFLLMTAYIHSKKISVGSVARRDLIPALNG
jgi:hypothetical protein